MMGILNTVNLHEATLIKRFQDYFWDYDSMFLTITKVSDPAYAMSILFPVAASVNTPLGADILVVTVVAEWLNILLKWFLMEDRPFWWVREHGYNNIELRHTPLTCETGPGSPSGHVMGSAAVLYALLRWANANFINNNNYLSFQQKKKHRQFLWAVVLVALTVISLSRIFVAAHFPHQCVLGALIGLIVGDVLTDRDGWYVREWWRGASRFQLFIISLCLTAFSIVVYFLQLALGVDPQWSLVMALKWCHKAEYVNVATTPLFSQVRVCGASFGLAMASPITLRSDMKFYPVLGVSLVIMFVFSLHFLTDLIPTANAFMFYTCHFCASAAQPFLLLFVVPVIASLVKVKEE